MKIDSYVIAKIAGVSQATVSRTFSNPEKVAPATKKKVLDTAESLGYRPDRNASALRRKGTNTILLLYVKREEGHYWTNVKRNYWIFAEAVFSLTSFFEYHPYIFEIQQVNSVYALRESDIKERCDGLIVFDFVTEEEARHIQGWSLPYVLCHRTIQLADYNHSSTDNRVGGMLQAEYLQNKGCSRPLYVMNDEDPFSHVLRKEGFLSVFPEATVVSASDFGYLRNRLSAFTDRAEVDGIAFVNDMLLVQVLSGMQHSSDPLQRGLPVIGYDNSTILQVLESRPASIEIGIAQIYREAAGALLQLMRNEIGSIDLVHPPEIIA